MGLFDGLNLAGLAGLADKLKAAGIALPAATAAPAPVAAPVVDDAIKAQLYDYILGNEERWTLATDSLPKFSWSGGWSVDTAAVGEYATGLADWKKANPGKKDADYLKYLQAQGKQAELDPLYEQYGNGMSRADFDATYDAARKDYEDYWDALPRYGAATSADGLGGTPTQLAPIGYKDGKLIYSLPSTSVFTGNADRPSYIYQGWQNEDWMKEQVAAGKMGLNTDADGNQSLWVDPSIVNDENFGVKVVDRYRGSNDSDNGFWGSLGIDPGVGKLISMGAALLTGGASLGAGALAAEGASIGTAAGFEAGSAAAGATTGAAMGAMGSGIAGENPLEGALIGGITGGAMNGLGINDAIGEFAQTYVDPVVDSVLDPVVDWGADLLGVSTDTFSPSELDYLSGLSADEIDALTSLPADQFSTYMDAIDTSWLPGTDTTGGGAIYQDSFYDLPESTTTLGLDPTAEQIAQAWTDAGVPMSTAEAQAYIDAGGSGIGATTAGPVYVSQLPTDDPFATPGGMSTPGTDGAMSTADDWLDTVDPGGSTLPTTTTDGLPPVIDATPTPTGNPTPTGGLPGAVVDLGGAALGTVAGGGLLSTVANTLGLTGTDLTGTVLGTLLSAGGNYLSNEAYQDAAQTAANAQIEAAKIAADAAKFRPVGVTTRFGSSNFTTDDKGNVTGAGYTLSPDVLAQQDKLFGASNDYLTQYLGAKDATAPMGTQAQRLFDLGAGYLATDPQAQAQKYLDDQLGLLGTSRERDLAALENRLLQQGRLGLATGGTSTGMSAANPELEAYFNAIRQQDLQLAADATRGGMEYAKFGAGLTGLGGNMLNSMYGTQRAAFDPYWTALGGVSGLESLGQNAMDLGINIGAKGTAARADAGRLMATGMTNAAQTMQPANQISQWGGLLSGAGDALRRYQWGT